MRKYYEAYDERYKTIHEKGYRWMGEENTPIVFETVRKYGFDGAAPMLEIGCGEGRDAGFLLERGYDLIATDVSAEAVAFCKEKYQAYASRFRKMDCLQSEDENRYAFIYSVAVLHMLLLDEDRTGFLRFIHDHLTERGIALICTMGNGRSETTTDIDDAFRLCEREHPLAGKIRVAGTSCRTVSFPHFESELSKSRLQILEKGVSSCPPDFGDLTYAIVKPT